MTNLPLVKCQRAECQKEFTPVPQSRGQRFCCYECRYREWRKNNPEVKEQQRLRQKRYRRAHPGQCRERSAEWMRGHPGYLGPTRQKMVDWAVAFRDKPCKDCGGKFHFSAMDLDHRPGVKKVGSVSEMIARGRPSSEVKREAEKCDVVCANCHRVRTWKRNQQSRLDKLSKRDSLTYDKN